jgi:hypothetical protein
MREYGTMVCYVLFAFLLCCSNSMRFLIILSTSMLSTVGGCVVAYHVFWTVGVYSPSLHINLGIYLFCTQLE